MIKDFDVEFQQGKLNIRGFQFFRDQGIEGASVELVGELPRNLPLEDLVERAIWHGDRGGETGPERRTAQAAGLEQVRDRFDVGLGWFFHGSSSLRVMT